MTDPDKGTWQHEYNAYGDVIVQTNADNQKTATDSDQYGRPIRRTDFKAGGAKEEFHTRWYYDEKGAAGETVANALGKITAVVHSQSSSDEQCYLGSAEYCELYSYDSYGRSSAVASVVGKSGAEGEYVSTTSYDGLGRPYRQYDALDKTLVNAGKAITSGVQSYYTSTGHLRYVKDIASGNELYRIVDVNTRGQVAAFDVVNGLVRVDHGYDSATGRLDTQLAKNSLNSTLLARADTWDKVGDLTGRNDHGPVAGTIEWWVGDGDESGKVREHIGKMLDFYGNK